MQNVYRTIFPFAILSVVIAVILIVTSRSNPQNYPFTIDTVSSACLTEPHDLDIEAKDNSIFITTHMETPNPCYSVVGDIKFFGRDIEVNLSAISSQQICIQCIGEITGKVVIQNLTKGVYSVKVMTPYHTETTPITVE